MSIFVDKELVVLPWDFSKLSTPCLEKAFDMVGDISQLRVVYVNDYPASSMSPVSYLEHTTEEAIRQNIVKSFSHHLGDDARFKALEIDVLFGDPGTEICRYAEKFNAGIIVLPSHGRSGLAHLLLGSVAERVIRLATCPVLIMRGLWAANDRSAEKKSAGEAGETQLQSQ